MFRKMIKKLRDLTREDLNAICGNNEECENCPLNHLNGISCTSIINNKEVFTDQFLNIKVEFSVPLLTEEERRYLEIVLGPFRDKVINIIKVTCSDSEAFIKISGDDDSAISMAFKSDKYFKNLELDHYYTLEELALYQEDRK